MTSGEAKSTTLIVGAGIFGVSTAYHLSKVVPPSTITIIDRHPYPTPASDSKYAPYGASHDINKIVRADYSIPFYMKLAQEAIESWQSWDLINKFYHRTGWVRMNESGSDMAQKIRQNFSGCDVGDETKDMSFEEAKTSWNGLLKDMDVSGYDGCYFNPGAGWAEADKAVEAILSAAVESGVQYRRGNVTELCLSKDTNNPSVIGVKLHDGTELHANKTLLASGAWTGQLMSGIEELLNIPEEKSIESQVKAAGVCLVTFELDEKAKKLYDELPVVVYGSTGQILPPPPSRLLKFTNAGSFTNKMNVSQNPTQNSDSARFTISVPHPSQREVPEALKLETLDIVQRVAPSILTDGYRVAFWRTCWDSFTPRQDQLITKHPEISSLYFAVGGSFHSWKFLPTIGQYITNVLLDKSNGEEKDQRWCWKSESWLSSGRGAHENVIPKRDLKDLF